VFALRSCDWDCSICLSGRRPVATPLGTEGPSGVLPPMSLRVVGELSATLTLELLQVCPLSIRNCKHARELANDEEDAYCNLNGGRGTRGQVDVPPPPTEPEMTTF
jgi:hypothetical protein